MMELCKSMRNITVMFYYTKCFRSDNDLKKKKCYFIYTVKNQGIMSTASSKKQLKRTGLLQSPVHKFLSLLL